MGTPGGWRRATVVLAMLGLVVGGAVAAVFFFRIPIAEHLAQQVLGDTPAGPVSLRIDALEIDHTIIADAVERGVGSPAKSDSGRPMSSKSVISSLGGVALTARCSMS